MSKPLIDEQKLASVKKEEAQRRADRIHAFREELKSLEQEQILILPDDHRQRLDSYHEQMLKNLAQQFDVDTSSAQKQMSLGMRIASLLGALAISAAVFFFFYRFWGLFSTSIQVAILIGGPLVMTVAVEFSARREKTLYFSSIAGLVALACFVLNLTMLGQIFTTTPTHNVFLAWAAFSLLLAYTYGLRLLLVAGIICLMGHLAAAMGTWSGVYWLSFGERPENFIFAGIFLIVLSLIPHRRYYRFPAIYRFFGFFAVLTAILVLSHWGRFSYLTLPLKTVEHLYQIAGFVLAGFTVWLGISRHWQGVVYLGSTFFVVFLYTKFFDWWWDWMPKYIFFFILGVVAVVFLFILKKLRSLTREVRP